MSKQEALQELNRLKAKIKVTHDADGDCTDQAAAEYLGDVEYAIERIEAGDDIDEVMGNV